MASDENSIPPVTRNDPAAHSGDVVGENVAALKALFPSIVTDGKVDFDVLRQLLGDEVEEGAERYGLNWKGKARARAFALTPSLGALRPAKNDSKDWDATKNIVIEGDNLEVLKLLRKSYGGKVKLIYIDPPYNTGKDFVYPDNYTDSLANYEALTGQRGADGARMTSNKEASGRFHTDWLNMMYPRLMLAKELLGGGATIFISIGDKENANLQMMCNSLFGQDAFVGCVVWERKRKGSHLSPSFTLRTEYALIYSKIGADVQLFGEAAGEFEDQPLIKKSNPVGTLLIPAGVVETAMSDQTLAPGIYGSGASAVELLSSVEIKDGRFSSPVHLRARFIWTQSNLDLELGEGGRFFLRTMNLSLRALKAAHRQGYKALTSFLSREVGTNEDALSEIADLFQVAEEDVPFDYPKPVSYIAKLINAATYFDKDALILDFFAGSGTTGHAVMAQNAADGGNRRYILVQLPEPLDPAKAEQKTAADFCDKLGKPRTIAELTKERLRRAGEKVKADNPDADIDTGFRVYKLSSSNLKPWSPGDDLAADLLDAAGNILHGRSEEDLLVELLLKTGIDLTLPAETREIAGCTVHCMGGGTLIVCLSDIPANEARSLGDGVADWLAESPPPAPTTFFFKDSGFDPGGERKAEARSNLAATLRQRLGKDAIEKLGAI